MTTSIGVSPALEDFLAQVRSVNPFLDNRVNGPAPGDVDVAAIHREAFEQLTLLAEEACGERHGIGVMLLGEAGIGKSHLLARLSQWAGDLQHACFVYLHNLQAGPEHLPRSLLHAVVSILTRGRSHRFRGTPLFRLAASFAHEAFGYVADRRPSLTDIRRAWDRLFDRFAADPARAALADHTAFDVLFHFFQSAYLEKHGQPDGIAGLAVRWLGGSWLEPQEARRLGLPVVGPDEPAGLRDNQQIKQVLVALSRLTQGRKVPLLLCFDQADNLEAEQMASLARFLEALIDSAPNLLVVTAGVQASLLHWRETKVIQDSAWDRLAQVEIALLRIPTAAAEPLVAARLDRFFEPYRHLPEVCHQVQNDPLFPLGQDWLDRFLQGKAELRPRDVISGAREGWHRQQEVLRQTGSSTWLAAWSPPTDQPESLHPLTEEQIREAIDGRIEQALRDYADRCEAEPYNLPPDAAHLAGLVSALLAEYRQADPFAGIGAIERPEATSQGVKPAFDLLVRCREADGREAQTGMLCLITDHPNATAAYLRRLCHAAPAPDRLLLVTDQRRPLVLGDRGKEYLAQLEEELFAGRFRRVDLSFSDYVNLNGLSIVARQARSGNLEINLPGGEARQISEAEVIASHRRRGRYRTAPILRELVTLTETALAVSS